MITFEEILQKLKKREYAPIYLLMGEEPFYIDRLADYMEEHIMEAADRDFNQMVIYANDKEADAANVIAAAREYPFGTPYRVIIVKEAKDLKHFDLLKDYAANPSLSTILVICYKYGKPKATQYKPFEKNGVIFASDKIKDNKLADWIAKQAQENQFVIKPNAASIIAENIGNDLTRIYHEFQKFKIFLPANSEITPEIIEKHIGISKEYNVFELQNALGERNVQKAFKIVLNMCANIKENPIVKIIAVLYPFFYKMLAYQLAPDRSPQTIEQIYGKAHPYVIQINTSYAQRYSIPELRKIISLLREFDVKSKGVNSESSDEELLKELTYKILY